VLDRERILAKLDELYSYLDELKAVAPRSYPEYEGSVEKRRACERLLHISIECVIDVCHLIVSGLRLGLPAGEGDLFAKLEQSGIISRGLADTLRRMKAFKNILVQRYGRVDDRLVYDVITRGSGDFDEFRNAVLKVIGSR